MSERALFRMHQRNGFPVVTLRPPYLYGPGNPYYRESFFWDRLRDNRQIILPGDGRRLMQFVYVKDLIWAAMKAVEDPHAVGHAFNIANPKPVTQFDLVHLLAEIAGKQAHLVRIPRPKISQLGGHPMGPNLYFGMYFDMPAITQVINKAQRMLKFQPTDFKEGLKETYKWYLRHHHKDASNYPFEDKLIANAPPYIPED
jgi:nucleoside-diphosphate-sugar epimerase